MGPDALGPAADADGELRGVGVRGDACEVAQERAVDLLGIAVDDPQGAHEPKVGPAADGIPG